MEITVIEKLMETLAAIRDVSVEVIRAELAADNAHTMNEMFRLACAFEASAA